MSNKTIKEGTIYTSTWVIPFADMQDSSLASKAEESYTGVGGGLGIDYSNLSGAERLIEGAQTGISIAEDMGYSPIADEIKIQIDWQQNESGLFIDSLTVENYAPVGISIQEVSIYGGPGERFSIPGKDEWVGVEGDNPGILNMDINTYLSTNWNSEVFIQFYIHGGFPIDQYKRIFFPVGSIPDVGCTGIP